MASMSVSLVRDSTDAPLYFIVHLQDETERHRAEAVRNDRCEALEMIAQDQPLPSILHQLVRMIERQVAGAWACVMLPNNGTMRLFGPSMPPAMIELIKRRPIKFCADLTATESNTAGVPRVADIDTDPAWDEMREDARYLRVQCCWATGLTARDTLALGTLVIFLPVSRLPDAFEQKLLETAARLVTIAVEHHQTTRQLAHLVRHDPLTGLPNRIMFEDRLYHSLSLARRHSRPLALLAMDLNRFKQVNDTLGHQAGDMLLQQFAQRVRSKLRECDTLARVGGDEFMLILSDVKCREEAQMVADRVTRGLASAQFELAGHSMNVTSSIGIAIFPADGDDAMQLQRAADAAMYKAKELSRQAESGNAHAKSA
jgi:diguanylate cyclase (GGDEF)-like protein